MKEIILTKRKSGLLSVITCILFLAVTAGGAGMAVYSGMDKAAPWIGVCAAGLIALLCHAMVMRRGMPSCFSPSQTILPARRCLFTAASGLRTAALRSRSSSAAYGSA